MKKILVASDSFKGSLSSGAVAKAASEAICAVFPDCETIAAEVADGGEGTADALCRALGGRKVSAEVHDPLGRPVAAFYALIGKKAVIEMASASGLTLLSPEERNPLSTSTFGTGELILDAYRRGCREFLVAIGGSATCDGGAGMLSALGVRFFDASGGPLSGRGCDLARIDSMDLTGLKISGCKFDVACDVDTPFCGPDGAAAVFGPQKGAGPEEVRILEAGMSHFAELILKQTGTDISRKPGAGAAGGLGGAFHVFLGATLRKGIDLVLDALSFDTLLAGANLVITGEGQADFQTPKGKTAAGVLQRARAAGIPTLLLAGRVEPCPELAAMGFCDILEVTPRTQPLSEALLPSNAAANIKAALTAWLRKR